MTVKVKMPTKGYSDVVKEELLKQLVATKMEQMRLVKEIENLKKGVK